MKEVITAKVMEEVEREGEKFTFEQGLQCTQLAPDAIQIGLATADLVSKASSPGLTNVIEVSAPAAEAANVVAATAEGGFSLGEIIAGIFQGLGSLG